MSPLYKLTLICLLVSAQAFAQNSPYSQIGIGDVNSPAFAPHIGIGGVGASHADGIHINYINPALLARNKSTVFDAGINGQWKKIQSNTSTQQDLSGNLGYLAYAFPVTRKWTLGAGLRPYSTVDYEINSVGTVAGSQNTANYIFKGEGGLTSVDFTNAVNVVNGLYIGLKASYIFGNITHESVSQVNDSISNTSLAYVNRTNYSDLLFVSGISYRRKLKDKVYINAGFVYDFQADIKGTRFTAFQPRNPETNQSLLVSEYDTISKDLKGAVRLPAQYKLGLSIDSPLRWALAADFSYQNWSNFRNYDVKAPLNNSYTVAVGGEWIPNIASVSNYLKRMTYRAGVNYTKTPLTFNGEQLNDISVSLGTSLPVGRGISDLNLGFVFGQRGTLNSNLIKEQYVRVSLGFTLNGFYDGWFAKPKID